jgi:hypothetical protein
MEGWYERLISPLLTSANDIELKFEKLQPLIGQDGNPLLDIKEVQEFINLHTRLKHFTVTRYDRSMAANTLKYGVINIKINFISRSKMFYEGS